ncbi:MAG: O-acetyl-ADP-ribose deacetylase [Acidobacteriota bacterium]|jgi:O-acetyl-ADP-ribose deacetylase (regulator of RNase III)
MEELEVRDGRIRLVQGDITRQAADAIVTAANAALAGGGGVDGAVHRAAGPGLLAACREIGGCPTGSAVRTGAFGLQERGIRHVIHAVGPVWRGGGEGEADHLRCAYRRGLELAEEAGCSSLAFPSISTGVYGFPVERAAPIAIGAAREFLAADAASLREVVFVLFDAATLGAFREALEGLR